MNIWPIIIEHWLILMCNDQAVLYDSFTATIQLFTPYVSSKTKLSCCIAKPFKHYSGRIVRTERFKNWNINYALHYAQ